MVPCFIPVKLEDSQETDKRKIKTTEAEMNGQLLKFVTEAVCLLQ